MKKSLSLNELQYRTMHKAMAGQLTCGQMAETKLPDVVMLENIEIQ
jgi:hypothetical protein